jgi:alkylation response protein AidB-like acyl-CoA dehydrogenase
MRETPVERYARDARLLPIGGGTMEFMNELVGRSLGL